MFRWSAAAVALFFLLPGALRAQGPAISGTVRDEAGVPVPDAEVLLDLDRRPARGTRTDDQGRYSFGDVGKGVHKLRYQRIGYFPQDLGTIVGESTVQMDVVLRRLPSTLDTIRVHGLRVGVVGLVVAHFSQRPVDSATVEVLRTHARTTTGRNGQFSLTDSVPPGAQVVLAKASGYETRLLSVAVPESSTVEVAMMMDRDNVKGAKKRAMPLAEMESRTEWLGTRAFLFTAGQLQGTYGHGIEDSPVFRQKMLELRELSVGKACILVDGWQKVPNLDAIDVGQVEALEVYAPGTDYSGTLELRGCAGSGAFSPVKGNPRSVARHALRRGPITIVVWLKK